MKFSSTLFLVFACIMVVAIVSASPVPAPEPGWNPFKALEKVGQNIRDGIIKAGPAVAVVGQTAALAKSG